MLCCWSCHVGSHRRIQWDSWITAATVIKYPKIQTSEETRLTFLT